ncbi:hypothetical protein D6M20_01550 (plasmid) [Rhodococcus qingshengii]|jgi:hypothetical protein|uniref:hypothetical protein n=1 Tax=Rhodococcus qingshengii TaxID=334542 RepID=UPI0011EF1048|nr:hypothetical protein [Rhodococcus qingshengii]QEM25540.1 hypothetical protein D6M20_01550 [Rhodococcus qingshengii]
MRLSILAKFVGALPDGVVTSSAHEYVTDSGNAMALRSRCTGQTLTFAGAPSVAALDTPCEHEPRPR